MACEMLVTLHGYDPNLTLKKVSYTIDDTEDEILYSFENKHSYYSQLFQKLDLSPAVLNLPGIYITGIILGEDDFKMFHLRG